MSKKKIIGLSVAIIFLVPAILDVIRYLKPDAENKKTVQPFGAFPIKDATEIIFVYNAWGGIYPGLIDVVHKEFFPKTYPCNLCYQAFGTFGKKDGWTQFLETLSYTKTELHKEKYQRLYEPENMQQPTILMSNGKEVQVLLSADELNQFKSLDELIMGVMNKLKTY